MIARRRGTSIGWLLLALSLAALGSAVLFELQSPLEPGESPMSWIDVLWATSFFGYPTVGAIIVASDRRNTIGWLLLSVGVLLGLGLAFSDYPDFAVLGRDRPLPGYVAAAWLSSWVLAPAFGSLPLLLIVFPSGRFETRFGRALGALAILGLIGMSVSGALSPGRLSGTSLANPVGIAAFEGLLRVIGNASETVLLAVVPVVAALRLLVRLRRARGDARQQMKWFVYAVVTAVLVLVGVALIESSGANMDTVGVLAFILALNSIAVSLGIAVLKYRLYDIDVVISKTVVFAGLAGFITAIYVSIVVGVGSLLGAGDEPNLGLSIVATAVVAVAFQPVRERLTRLANRLVFGRRATPYEVLSRFSSHLGDTVATEDTLERMARLLADGTGAAHAQVSLLIGGAMVPAASVGDVVDASADAHTVQVAHQGETLGALSVTKKRGESLTPADVKLVDDLAAQAGLLLRNVRLTEELKQKIVDLRASRQRLVAAQDQERRRLERDLHDGAQQQIVAIKLKLGLARTIADKEGAAKTVALVEQLTRETDQAVQTLRELAHGIYPPLLAAEGLTSAVTTAARRAPVPVAVHADGVGRYDQDIESAVYFCVLEAVTNAAKYAEPSQVTIRLAEHEGQLTFTVTDDGAGFDPATTPTGHGLTNMTDRLDALGGELHLTSHRGSGTTVTGSIPVTMPAPVGAS